MAFTNFPVLRALPDILTIYNLAPWLWDGAIICAVLGLFFREGFKRIKLGGKGTGGEEDKSEKLGGLFGFALGLITLIGMYRKGYQLIDLWPGVVLLLIIFGAVLLWKWLHETVPEEYKSSATIFVIIITLLVLGLFMGSMQRYLSNILGGWLMLILMMAFWCALIFLLVWLLKGFGGITFTKDDGGLIGKIFGGIKDFVKGGLGLGWDGLTGAGGGIRDWWKGRGKKPKTPDEAGPDVDKTGKDASKKAGDAKKAGDKASSAGQKAIEEVEKLEKIKKGLEESLRNLKNPFKQMKGDEKKDWKDRLKFFMDSMEAGVKKLKDQYDIFMKADFIKNFDEYTKKLMVFISEFKLFNHDLILYYKAFDSIREKIKVITEKGMAEEATRFTEELEKYDTALKSLDASLNARGINFEKELDETLGTSEKDITNRAVEELDNITKQFKIINDTFKDIIIPKIKKLIEYIEKAEEANIQKTIKELDEKIIDVLGACKLMNESIDNFKKYVSYIDKIIEGLRKLSEKTLMNELSKARAQFAEIRKEVEILEAQIDALLKSLEKGEEKEVKELQAIKDAVLVERESIKQLINSAKTFNNTMTATLISKKGALVKKDEAEKDYKDTVATVNTLIKDHVARLQKGKERVDAVLKNVGKLLADVTTRISAIEAGATASKQERDQLTRMKNNLTQFLQYDRRLEEVLNKFEVFFLTVVSQEIKSTSGVEVQLAKVQAAVAKEITEIENVISFLDWELVQATPPTASHGSPTPPRASYTNTKV